MKLWMALYGMIWIVFLEFLLAMTPVADPTLLIYAHIALGVVIVGLAFYNFNGVRRTAVPARIKRIANSTFSLSVLMVILGLLVFFDVGKDWVIPLLNLSIYGILLFFHVVNAFAIITQAAAVAIAYDMWEEKEFAQETEPGSVPTRPMPKAANPKA
jgi:hypothetical protein